MVHTDEPRVGENRSLGNVCQEAKDFLRDLCDEGFFADKAAFEARLQEVFDEIVHGARDGIAREDKIQKRLGGSWTQTYKELEFGVRRSWRNSRKCIARNHHQDLKLCDLRSITTSAGMAKELLRNAIQAFNNGRIEPTAFVFAPRQIDGRGAMIWNNQILGFAGYRMDDDGSILGDPANLELTTAIMELGWTPPKTRGRWDLLPLVVMAEGDKPAMMEIPAPLSRLVHINHPEYPRIGELGLKWVAAPALTRLGFDIGGVQYTAAPFIGWFMDAEIGVRNLTDSFRYNVLPDVIKAMGLAEGRFKDGLEDFEDLPEYEQLKMLSNAQSELTYATQLSFNQAGITMSDSLTASKKWCKFDDEFKEKNGYRLPADPYWIAPPQGSIIPLWHRGGAPNYQPKPMISKHVQDPIKAWRREKSKGELTTEPTEIMTLRQSVASLPELFGKKPEVTPEEADEYEDADTTCSISPLSNSLVSWPSSSQTSPSRSPVSRSSTSTLTEQKSIAIYFCSAGTVAEKLARRLYKTIESLKDAMNVALHPSVQSLDYLNSENITQDKILLMFVSSTGKGEVPANGAAFLRLKAPTSFEGVSFAVFGNGDSRYSATYNGAAKLIDEHMLMLGGRSMIGKVFRGDTATEPIPYKAVKNWWTVLQPKVEELLCGSKLAHSSVPGPGPKGHSTEIQGDDAAERLVDYSTDLPFLKDASIVSTKPATSLERSQRSMLLTLDIGTEKYKDMNCIQILPLNHPSKVDRALIALNIDRDDTFEITEQGSSTNAEFLSSCADLERPFKSMDWLSASQVKFGSLMEKMFGQLSALESLELLRKSNLISQFETSKILHSMDLLYLRTYSVASSPNEPTSITSSSSPTNNTVSIMLKRIPSGRFSTTFLEDHAGEIKPLVKYRIVDSVAGPSVRSLISDSKGNAGNAPLILIATGAGFGPIRNLIKARIAAIQKERANSTASKISIYLGLHPTDVPLVKPTLQVATQLGLTEKVEIVEGNEDKRRVQGALSENADPLKKAVKEQGGHVFVCANEQAAEGIKDVFMRIMPAAWEEGKKPDWYLEENF